MKTLKGPPWVFTGFHWKEVNLKTEESVKIQNHQSFKQQLWSTRECYSVETSVVLFTNSHVLFYVKTITMPVCTIYALFTRSCALSCTIKRCTFCYSWTVTIILGYSQSLVNYTVLGTETYLLPPDYL